ncbi:MAG: hypothetical protein NC177_05910 [Ruminococcus flavefaciens]|nr:hypothetical protein [Ruminococcus flavefaciens]
MKRFQSIVQKYIANHEKHEKYPAGVSAPMAYSNPKNESYILDCILSFAGGKEVSGIALRA